MKKNKNQIDKEVEAASAKMRKAFPKAVDTLIELLASKNEGVKLQAARAIRDLILGKFNK
jgi:HEAT repeat protein